MIKKIAFILILSVTHVTFPMKYVRPLCTGLYLIGLYYPTGSKIHVPSPKEREELFSRLKKVDYKTKEFLKKHLTDAGFQTKGLSFKYADSYISFPQYQTILIPADEFGKARPLEALIKKLKHTKTDSVREKIQTELNQHLFALEHEATHIRNNDSRKENIAQAGIPLVINFVTMMLNPWHRSLRLDYQLAKIPAGALSGVLSLVLCYTLFRRQEFKADDGVTNQIPLLQAGLKILARHDKLEQKHEKAISRLPQALQLGNHEPSRSLISQGLIAYHRAFSDHPTSAARMARIARRLESLQAIEDQKIYDAEVAKIMAQAELTLDDDLDISDKDMPMTPESQAVLDAVAAMYQQDS